MVRTSLEQALYEHSVEAPVLRSIVVLACPSQVRLASRPHKGLALTVSRTTHSNATAQHAAAKLMRAIDLVLSYLVVGDAAAGQRDGHARAGEPLAAALAAHHTPSVSGAASPEAAALTATIHPVVWEAPGRRRAAGLVRGRGGAEVCTRRHRPLPPAVGLYSHAHAMLLARYRAHPNALDALSPAVASAVLRALEADGGSDGGTSQPALPLLGAGVQAPDEEARMDASPLVCGITLEPVLDGRGHLVPGTVALVQATSQGVLHAHLYRGPALATWLAASGGRGHTHPATRAPVDAARHVHPLC